MNLTEKETIRYWRGEGLGYKAIAAKTGLTASAVKGYCQRSGLGGDAQTLRDLCRHCGKPIVQQPKRKPRKFCCDACCQAWWNSHAFLVEKRANYKLRCAHCGREFISYGNRGRKYCGHPCYIAARFGKDVSRYDH